MKKITRITIPIIAALAISIAASNISLDSCCSYQDPIVAVGSIFGCSDVKNAEPKNEPARLEGSAPIPVPNSIEKPYKGGIKVTFVEIGSVRCIPCKMMQPIMKAVEEEYKGQVRVVFHDVWTAQGKPYAAKYRIKGIPTQVFLDKDGNEYYRHLGFFPKDELVKVLKQKGVR